MTPQGNRRLGHFPSLSLYEAIGSFFFFSSVFQGCIQAGLWWIQQNQDGSSEKSSTSSWMKSAHQLVWTNIWKLPWIYLTCLCSVSPFKDMFNGVWGDTQLMRHNWIINPRIKIQIFRGCSHIISLQSWSKCSESNTDKQILGFNVFHVHRHQNIYQSKVLENL